jgi:hypothetical protein
MARRQQNNIFGTQKRSKQICHPRILHFMKNTLKNEEKRTFSDKNGKFVTCTIRKNRIFFKLKDNNARWKSGSREK